LKRQSEKEGVILIQDTVLQRLQRFKTTFLSSNLPSEVLLELMESYIKSDDELTVEDDCVFDGQLSLLDLAAII